jgi:hypothetical protein
MTPPWKGVFGPGVGPWSWISVYGQPGVAMTASVTAPDVLFVESGRNLYDFTIPNTGRAEFRLAYYMKTETGTQFEPLHTPTERLAAKCTVQSQLYPTYQGSTDLIFASYTPVNTEIFSYGISTGAPGNDRDSGLAACCSIYLVVTPNNEEGYKTVYVDFNNNTDVYIPGSPDNIVPLTPKIDSDRNQYAMINVRYPNNKRQTIHTTFSVQGAVIPPVNVPLSFIEFPVAASDLASIGS